MSKERNDITDNRNHNVYSVFGGKVIDKRVIQHGLNEEAVQKLLEEWSADFYAKFPGAVRDIMDDIIESKFNDIICRVEKQIKNEEEFERAIQANFARLQNNFKDVTEELVAEYHRLADADRTQQENLEKLSRQIAWQADESYKKLVSEYLAPIKNMLTNVRWDFGLEFEQGYEAIRKGDFEVAKRFFGEACKQEKYVSDAYFGLALADCKIQLIWDEVNCIAQPICYDFAIEFAENAYYKAALERATAEQKTRYVDFTEEIQYIQKKFADFENEGLNYDCFICVKVRDELGHYTYDSDRAREFYNLLHDDGYHPFYSEVIMPTRGGSEYEAHILYALNTAKCMLIFCSDEKYLKTPWVKNEYSRYLELIKYGERNEDSIAICFCGDGHIIQRLPGKRHNLQSFALRRIGTETNMLDYVRRFCGDGDFVSYTSSEHEAEQPVLPERRQEEKRGQKTEGESDKQGEIKKAEEIKNPQEEPQTKPELAPDYPTLGNYDKSAFEIVDTVLKKYTGNGGDVKIPFGVTAIDREAFRNCSSIKNIFIPNGVISIDGLAFGGCANLKSIEVDVNNNKYSSQDGILYNKDKTQIIKVPLAKTVIKILDSVTSISPLAFSGCTCITSITAGANNAVYSSQDGILFNKNKTQIIRVPQTKTEITIPDSVTSIGDMAFTGCQSLASIIVDKNNTEYTSVNGILYDKDKNKIIRVPQAKTEIEILNGVNTIGHHAFEGCANLTSISIPDTVKLIGKFAFEQCNGLKSITIPDNVTFIGNWAFTNCANLKSVILPNSITAISGFTFSFCENLESITIPDNVTSIGGRAFSWCKRLKSVAFGDNSKLKSIDDYAFSECKSLASIIIPDSVTSIGKYTFSYCTSLKSVIIPDGVTSIGFKAFEDYTEIIRKGKIPQEKSPAIPWFASYYPTLHYYDTSAFEIVDTVLKKYTGNGGAVKIPKGVTSIGDYAFSGCTSLTSIIIPASVISIGRHAFDDCKSLTSINIPPKITSIGDWAFRVCTSLPEIKIPDSVKLIGKYAFYSCESLKSVNISSNSKLEKIDDGAFSYCTSLKSITIPDRVHISWRALAEGTEVIRIESKPQEKSSTEPEFAPDYPTLGNYDKSVFKITGTVLKKYTGNGGAVRIPKGVTSIGERAFYGCTNLTSIIIHDSVTSIGKGALRGCSNLASVNFGNTGKLETIGDYAFSDCTSLTSITIPDSVTSIGGDAFSSCTSLESINVGENNTAYKSQNGILFNKDKTKIISVPGAKTTVTIPDGVTFIGKLAFEGCTNLTSVTFENSICWEILGIRRRGLRKETVDRMIRVTDPAKNAKFLTSIYCGYEWRRGKY